MDLLTGATVLGHVLGAAAAGATPAQITRAADVAAAVNAAMTTRLDWPVAPATLRVATAGELADLTAGALAAAAELWRIRDTIGQTASGPGARPPGDDWLEPALGAILRHRQGAAGNFG